MQREKKAWGAAIAGLIYGALLGAAIGASFNGGQGALLGALGVGLYAGAAEAITDIRRKPGQMKPLLHRIIGHVLMGAAFGALVSAVFGPLVTGILIGFLFGLMSLGPRRLLLGVVIGIVLGLIASQGLIVNGAILGGLVALTYRIAEIIFFRNAEPFQLAAERVPPEEARYVVPFESREMFIGTGYMEALAQQTEGVYTRNQEGIGLIDSLDMLRGPHFDPALVDARIRDFYEHTSRYRLVIVPEWNRFMRPIYRLYKQNLAQTIGQANLPFDIEEAQRGVVSYIDSIDYVTPEQVHTVRGWIRAFEATGEAIYVGIYTVVRHEDIGYVSVGFPLPESNFSATLLPYNHNGSGLLLKTQGTGLSFPGHYLSDIDNDTGALTVFKMPTFGEEIEVYVQDGQIKTDHRFYLGGFKFLTLFYSITPKTDHASPSQ
jgi:hypothetical protein